MKRLFPVLSIAAVILLAYALYLALVVAPTDVMQGNVYRIIYYHVPSAWTAFLLFFINFVASVRYLVRSKPSLERSANWIAVAIGVVGFIAPFLPPVRKLIPAGMEPGAVATTIVLIPVFYFLVGKWFPGERLDVLAVTSAAVGVVFCFNPGAMADLCQLPGSATFLEQCADADAGGGSRRFWGAGCASGLPFHLVLPDTTSAAGDRWRRIDGSPHAARAFVQLDGVPVVWISRLVVALPSGVTAPRS